MRLVTLQRGVEIVKQKRASGVIWFLLALILIPAVLAIYIFVVDSVDKSPSFFSMSGYMKIMIEDPLFLRALGNTMLIPTIFVIVGFTILWWVRRRLQKRRGLRIPDALFYPLLVLLSPLAFLFQAGMIRMALPPNYAVHTTAKLTAFISPVSVFTWCLFLEIVVFILLCLWLIEFRLERRATKASLDSISAFSND